MRPRGGVIEQVNAGRVRADAATTINGLVRWTVQRGIAGLEAWAGTPGTVGGAIYGNAHFGGRLIGELVESVRLAALNGATRDLPRDEMEFGYDRSRLQKTGEVLLSAVFRVSSGDPAALRDVARQSLAYRKTDAAARHAERRVHFSESRSARTCPQAFPLLPARSSIVPG